jgi:hypothetical protein
MKSEDRRSKIERRPRFEPNPKSEMRISLRRKQRAPAEYSAILVLCRAGFLAFRWSLDLFIRISGRRPASYQPRAIALGSLPISAIAGQRPASPHFTIPQNACLGGQNSHQIH